MKRDYEINENSGIYEKIKLFRIFRYFRLFRNLSSFRLHAKEKKMAQQNHPRLNFQLLLIILSLALIGCSSSPGSGSPFEGIITAKYTDESEAASMKFLVKANLFRLEMLDEAEMAAAPKAVIMDLKSGVQKMIDPQEKKYLEINLSELTESDGSEKDERGPITKLTPTGKTETIAGHTCEHYLLDDPEKTDFCLAKGMVYTGSEKEFGGGLMQVLRNKIDNQELKARMESDPEFKKLVESGAFPLKISRVENGQVKTIMEVTGIERKQLDDSLFKVPADYKKVEMMMPTGIPQR